MSRGFRVWDKRTKGYEFELDSEFVLSSSGELMELYSRHNSTWEYHFADTDRFIVEFDTGLKDKNSKEIYEGDIVKARWYRAKNARLDTKGEVKFADGWFYIDDDPDGQDRLGVPIHNCYDIEVIGNIHENPELLGDEE